MIKNVLLIPIRATQAVLSILVLALSAYVTNWYNTDTLTAPPAQINLLIFASIYSIVSLVLLEVVPRFFPRASNAYVNLGIEFTNTVFWFAGFVALAVFLSRLLFCRGGVCHAARADVAFAAFLWVAWTASQVLLAIELFAASGLRKRRTAADRMATGQQMSGGAGVVEKEVAA